MHCFNALFCISMHYPVAENALIDDRQSQTILNSGRNHRDATAVNMPSLPDSSASELITVSQPVSCCRKMHVTLQQPHHDVYPLDSRLSSVRRLQLQIS